MSSFVRFRRHGFSARIKPPCILVVNHLSFFDTFCIAMIPFFEVICAIRAWPFRMFWFAHFMRLAQYLNVETNEWNDTVQQSSATLKKGNALLFFPEGHRSRDGQLGRFYSGAFKLAIETGFPVVPLCITGTDRLLPPGRKWMAPTTIQLTALPPVDPKQFKGETAHNALRKYVKQQMADKLEQLRSNRD
jgi:1-acyl-sn-glycerol-3-phosphate acyltransferase